MCCGQTAKKGSQSSRNAPKAAPPPPPSNAMAIKIANQITAQMHNQLAMQQRMARKNPNNYQSRFM